MERFEGNPLKQELGASAKGHDMRNEALLPLLRTAGADGIVMLENDGTLPLQSGTVVSVFGRVAHNYMYTGYGSGGDVRTNTCVNLIDGLRACDTLTINEELATIYEAFAKTPQGEIADSVWGEWPRYYEEATYPQDVITRAREQGDVATVVIGRASGEDRENVLEQGGYYLRDTEKELLDRVTEAFSHVVIIINAGNVIDLSWTQDYQGKLSAILYAWQGGEQSGHQLADLLSGKATPSGRLTDTIAKQYADYISAEYFGDKNANVYFEDIFVGYRYFETFAKDKVMYPFGYGLSYTTFTQSMVSFVAENATATATVCVTNTGKTAGKEVVQLYVSKPDDVLVQPAVELVGFAKTGLLQPGESETITITVNAHTLASFDDTGITGCRHCFVLCKGTYQFSLGENARVLTPVGTWEQSACKMLEQLHNAAPLIKPIERLSYQKQGDTIVPCTETICDEVLDLKQRILQNIPQAQLCDAPANATLQDVAQGHITLDEFIASLTLDELDDLTRGEGMMMSDLGTEGNAGVYGGISQSLRAKGVPPIVTSDGPSGLRLQRYASLLPCGTQLACTFDTNLVQALFTELGNEMNAYAVDVVLSPGMNIHRNLLCGRNFEYYSEDPVVTGCIATSAVKGIQTHALSACPKHFACNNQEVARFENDSIVSQRALREIYFKGFEQCVKQAKPHNVMTSYNLVNGVWSHYHYDLAQVILRDEWGYEGVTITDWWMQPAPSPEFPSMKDNAYRVRASVDVLMPGGINFADHTKKTDGSLLATYGEVDGITLGEIQRTAKRVLRFCLAKITRAL